MDEKNFGRPLEIMRVVSHEVVSFLRQRYLYTLIKSQCIQEAYTVIKTLLQINVML